MGSETTALHIAPILHFLPAPAEDSAANVKIMIIIGVAKADCTAVFPFLSIEDNTANFLITVEENTGFFFFSRADIEVHISPPSHAGRKAAGVGVGGGLFQMDK